MYCAVILFVMQLHDMSPGNFPLIPPLPLVGPGRVVLACGSLIRDDYSSARWQHH
jgi:hypothetical protein